MLLMGHQPNYLPYPGLFEKAFRSDRFVIVDHVQFVKRGPFGWIHRNRIRTESPQGWDWLTVPVLTKGKFTQSIRETQIDNELPWARKHWRTLEWNYRIAPYYADYAPELRAVYEKSWKWLCDLSVELIRLMLRWLDIPRKLEFTSEKGIEGKATGLVVNMCKAFGADAYLSGMHGHDYLDAAEFDRAGIRLEFQEFEMPPYPQCAPGPFVPNLSVIDLLFNCGPKSRRILVGKDGCEA